MSVKITSENITKILPEAYEVDKRISYRLDPIEVELKKSAEQVKELEEAVKNSDVQIDELGERVSVLEPQITTINGKLILATDAADGFMSKEDFSKLAGIEAGAQANIIESVKVDGTSLDVSDKSVNLDLASRLAGYAKSIDVNTALDKKADKTTVETLSSKVATNETNIASITSQLSGLTGAMHFIGTSTTDPIEGATVPDHDEFIAGDVCLYGNKEYVFNGTTWTELGDEGSYLTKTEASSTYITVVKAANDIATAKSEAITEAGNEADTKIATALTNYTTTDDLNAALDDKVDKIEGYTLFSSADATKLAGIEEGAEKNIIASVDTDQFAIDSDRKLTLLDVDASKITNLSSVINSPLYMDSSNIGIKYGNGLYVDSSNGLLAVNWDDIPLEENSPLYISCNRLSFSLYEPLCLTGCNSLWLNYGHGLDTFSISCNQSVLGVDWQQIPIDPDGSLYFGSSNAGLGVDWSRIPFSDTPLQYNSSNGGIELLYGDGLTMNGSELVIDWDQAPKATETSYGLVKISDYTDDEIQAIWDEVMI